MTNLEWNLAQDLRAGDGELVVVATGAPVSSPGAWPDGSTAGATRAGCCGGLAAEIDRCFAKLPSRGRVRRDRHRSRLADLGRFLHSPQFFPTEIVRQPVAVEEQHRTFADE